MPIEPPNPHNILDALRSVLGELEELAAAEPSNALVRKTMTTVQAAIVSAEALAATAPAP